MSTTEVENFEVLDFGVSEQNSIVTKARLGLISLDQDIERSFGSLFEFKGDLFKAFAGVGSLRIGR